MACEALLRDLGLRFAEIYEVAQTAGSGSLLDLESLKAVWAHHDPLAACTLVLLVTIFTCWVSKGLGSLEAHAAEESRAVYSYACVRVFYF